MKSTNKQLIVLLVNGVKYRLETDPEKPLLYVLRNDLGLKSVKYGCGSEQCGACKALIDGQAAPTCKLPVKNVIGMEITTVEGMGSLASMHPLQEAFIEEQAIQCGYCTPGMITTAQSLLNRIRYPTDQEIRLALQDNLCRCGTHDRVRRAIKLRIGRPEKDRIFEIIEGKPLPEIPGEMILETGTSISLSTNPDLDTWIQINDDGTITILTGKVELGQGIKTALAQIAADELDVNLRRIRVASTDSAYSPDEGLTVGSMSLETSGTAIRLAAAEARHIILSIAYEELEAPLDRLQVHDGTVTDPISGRSTTYWDLFGGKRFGKMISGLIKPKDPEEYQIIGKPAPRLDLQEKVMGKPVFIHDLELPGMVHARVVRPPHYNAKLVSAEIKRGQKLPGVVKVIRDGSFLGVIATQENQAVEAMRVLGKSSVWEGCADFPSQDDIFDHLLSQPAQDFLVVNGTTTDQPIPAIDIPEGTERTLKATYYRPYQMHASIGPSASVALFQDQKLTLWVHSQGVFPIRRAIASVLRIAEEDIRVIQVEGAGCYGHNGADDAALDAALLALHLEGTPVSLKWMREDEMRWEPYGPAMVMKVQASLSPKREILSWNYDVWSYPHLGRPRGGDQVSDLVASWHLADPFQKPQRLPIHAPHIGSHRNADPLYPFQRKRIVKHFVSNSPLRSSAMRGLGAYGNIFAIESFMDELADSANIDPVEFRLQNLKSKRAKAVIKAAAKKAGWKYGEDLGKNRGRGIAFAQYKNRQCYTAVVVELTVNPKNGEIQLERVVIAADAGQVINPDGLSNQLEGGFIQAASWTLKEEVCFDLQGITSIDWDNYPVLRFPDMPKIEVILINRTGYSPLGSGEASQGPAGAAIANAIFNAVRVRLRQIPLTPKRVLSALGNL